MVACGSVRQRAVVCSGVQRCAAMCGMELDSDRHGSCSLLAVVVVGGWRGQRERTAEEELLIATVSTKWR